MSPVTLGRMIHYLAAIGVITNTLLATVLFQRIVRPLTSVAWSRFDASTRPLSFVLRAEWLQRGFLILSVVICVMLFMATRSPTRGEEIARLLFRGG